MRMTLPADGWWVTVKPVDDDSFREPVAGFIQNCEGCEWRPLIAAGGLLQEAAVGYPDAELELWHDRHPPFCRHPPLGCKRGDGDRAWCATGAGLVL